MGLLKLASKLLDIFSKNKLEVFDKTLEFFKWTLNINSFVAISNKTRGILLHLVIYRPAGCSYIPVQVM